MVCNVYRIPMYMSNVAHWFYGLQWEMMHSVSAYTCLKVWASLVLQMFILLSLSAGI